MQAKSSGELAERLRLILASKRLTLFAGAGVSAHANVPVWGQYIEKLAASAAKYEPLIAALMRKKLQQGELLEAAHYFKTCTEIPAGEKQNALTQPLSGYDSSRLISLCSIDFEMAVTTNYERSLHDAFSFLSRSAPKCAELRDPTLRESVFWNDFYIARIHGRVEVPSSMILDTADYDELSAEDDYFDFLRHVLTRRSLLFVGFSFLDPAISEVLDFVKKMGVFPKIHHAFVPAGQKGLASRMAEYNIEVIEYDPADDHRMLWDAFAQVSSGPVVTTDASAGTIPSRSFDTARKLLATCYTRVCMGADASALTKIVIQGILLSEMESGEESLSGLSEKLRNYLALSAPEAYDLTQSGVADLVARSICMQDGDVVVIVSKGSAVDGLPIGVLVDGVLSRTLVRVKLDVTDAMRRGIEEAIEETIVLRGYDLGAEFAGANLDNETDVAPTISAALDRHLPGYWQDKKALLAESLSEMLRHPDAREEKILGELGRLSFGIEIILQAGRSTVYSLSLPEVLYLDASVLMPAIVPGHPRRQAYMAAIAKLQQATRSAGRTTSIQFADVFLDEIISHRNIALQIYQSFGLEDPDTLARRIMFFGTNRVNVFIAGFSWWVSQPENKAKPFRDYLATEAPYNSRSELRQFLSKMGISVTSTVKSDGASMQRQSAVVDTLEKGYFNEESGLDEGVRKVSVLKRNEAFQLDLLARDLSENRRAVFVTADLKLRRAVAACALSGLRDALISPQNLIQLVDLLVGIDIPPQALARVLWNVKAADEKSMIKDYLVARALPHYDAAMLLQLNELLEQYSERVVKEAEQENVLLSPPPNGRLKTSHFMDRVESEIFANLATEVEKLRKKLKGLD